MFQSRLNLKESVINWLCVLWVKKKGVARVLYMAKIVDTID